MTSVVGRWGYTTPTCIVISCVNNDASQRLEEKNLFPSSIVEWNKLPVEMKHETSLNTFKKHLRVYLNMKSIGYGNKLYNMPIWVSSEKF